MTKRFKQDDNYGELWAGLIAIVAFACIVYFSFDSMGVL